MNNNILGLSIDRASQGLTNLITINGDKSWTTHVRDIRKELENVENLDGSSAALMLTCIDTGHLLTLGSWIEGRGGDYISAWIYIPASINIMGKDLVNVIEIVKQEILADRRDDDRLREVFAKTYALAEAKKITVQSSGEKYAYRCYGSRAKYTLAELLSEMFQPCYKNYKRVVLIDNATSHKCVAGDDLSSQKVLPMIVISAPGVVDEFEPYIDSQIFDKPICAIEDDDLEVRWKRSGYLPIKKPFKVVKGVKCPVPTRNEYKVIVKYDSIHVLDKSTNNKLTDYKLTINQSLVEAGKIVAISVDVISKSNVEISADGYDVYKEVLDLRKDHNTVYLQKKRQVYMFFMESKRGDNDNICIEYQTEDELESSPIRGYVLKSKPLTPERINKLLYRPYSLIMKLTLGFVMLLMLGLGFTGGWFLNNWFSGENELPKAKEIPKTIKSDDTEDEQENMDWEEIIKHLNSDKWYRSEMEKFGAADLWDYLNKYQFEEVLKYKDQLAESEKCKELLDEIERVKDSQKSGVYCDDDDITVQMYLDKLKEIEVDAPVATADN
jgi:hypothetical protein